MLRVMLLRTPYTAKFPADGNLSKDGLVVIDDDIVHGRNGGITYHYLSPEERFHYILNHELYHASRLVVRNKVIYYLYTRGKTRNRLHRHRGSFTWKRFHFLMKSFLVAMLVFAVLLTISGSLLSISMYALGGTGTVVYFLPRCIFKVEEWIAHRHAGKWLDRIHPEKWRKAERAFSSVPNNKNELHEILVQRKKCKDCGVLEGCWKYSNWKPLPPFFASRKKNSVDSSRSIPASPGK